jgi:hypothetical protein
MAAGLGSRDRLDRAIKEQIFPMLMAIYPEEAHNLTFYRGVRLSPYDVIEKFSLAKDKKSQILTKIGPYAHMLDCHKGERTPLSVLYSFDIGKLESLPHDAYLATPKEHLISFSQEKYQFFLNVFKNGDVYKALGLANVIPPSESIIFSAILSEISHIGNCNHRAYRAALLLRSALPVEYQVTVCRSSKSLVFEMNKQLSEIVATHYSILPMDGHAWVNIRIGEENFIYDLWHSPDRLYTTDEHKHEDIAGQYYKEIMAPIMITTEISGRFDEVHAKVVARIPKIKCFTVISDFKANKDTFKEAIALVSQLLLSLIAPTAPSSAEAKTALLLRESTCGTHPSGGAGAAAIGGSGAGLAAE